MITIKSFLGHIKRIEDDTGCKSGLIFCFGSSLISRLIQAKTRLNKHELVPSHVAMWFGDFLYESTTDGFRLGHKRIKSGVRRYLLTDFVKEERKKETKYVLVPVELDIETLEDYIHYPYGIDNIVDYMLKDGSQRESDGLICSQYANYCCKAINKPCVTPAELARVYHATRQIKED